jgi:hypothetical protein
VDPIVLIRIGAAILAIVFLDLLVVELRRIVREGRRLAERIAGYAELPLFSLIEATAFDVERLEASLSAIALLVPRARAALVALRLAAPDEG